MAGSVRTAYVRRSTLKSNRDMNSDLLTVKDITAYLRISRTTFFELRRAGDFPRPINLSPRRIAWQREAVRDWIKQREQPAPRPIF